MKHIKPILLIFSFLFLVSCNDKIDGGTPQTDSSGGGTTPLLSYSGNSVVTHSNASNFTFTGQCAGFNGSLIKLGGSFRGQTTCTGNTWSITKDLSSYPNGQFNATLTAGNQVDSVSFKILKNTLIAGESEAFYSFDDNSDLGNESRNDHDAQTITDVTQVNDSIQGLCASFNGSSSEMQLNDGTWFNAEFSSRTYAFKIKPQDIISSQVLIDEGGSTNGFAVIIDDSKIKAAIRAGGSGSQTNLEVDISGKEQAWINIVTGFDNGHFFLNVDGTNIDTTTSFTSIPSHSDTGGIGKRFGSGAFGGSSDDYFNGLINQFVVFNKSLSSDELTLLNGSIPAAVSYDPINVGLNHHYAFEEMSDPGKDEKGHNISSSNVSIIVDSTKGNVADFISGSVFQISNGSIFNDAFSVKSWILSVKTSDVFSHQVIVDEGGSTNGMALYIKNGYLIASVRSGGSNTQKDLIQDVSTKEDTWIDIAVVFNQGQFKMYIDDTVIERTTSFSTVAAHGNDGGLGANYGNSNAAGDSGALPFVGTISQFRIYENAISSDVLELDAHDKNGFSASDVAVYQDIDTDAAYDYIVMFDYSARIAGNNAILSITPPSTAGVTVDNDFPHSYSIAINGDSAATNNSAATLNITATNAAEMYVTNTAGCGSGGSWEAYETSKAWTLPSANAVNTVYIK